MLEQVSQKQGFAFFLLQSLAFCELVVYSGYYIYVFNENICTEDIFRHYRLERSHAMQRISFRKVKTSAYHVQPTEASILHFSLDGFLPTSHTLALNLCLS